MTQLTLTRTDNKDLIMRVLASEGIQQHICEDGIDLEGFEPDVLNECWISVALGSDVIGVYNLHAHNCVTVEVHAHIIPQYRKQFSYESALLLFKWLSENNPEYQKLVAVVPIIYSNVVNFTLKCGFVIEGLNRKSHLKNGQLHDQLLLGITKNEMEDILNG